MVFLPVYFRLCDSTMTKKIYFATIPWMADVLLDCLFFRLKEGYMTQRDALEQSTIQRPHKRRLFFGSLSELFWRWPSCAQRLAQLQRTHWPFRKEFLTFPWIPACTMSLTRSSLSPPGRTISRLQIGISLRKRTKRRSYSFTGGTTGGRRLLAVNLSNLLLNCIKPDILFWCSIFAGMDRVQTPDFPMDF